MSESELKTDAPLSAIVSMRLREEPRAALEAAAAQRGMSAAEYAKAAVLAAVGSPPEPRRRRELAPLNEALVRTAIAAVNRVGNNINQITVMMRPYMRVGPPSQEMAAALTMMQRDWTRALEALKEALGTRVKP